MKKRSRPPLPRCPQAEIQAAHQSGVYDLMVINKDQGVAETVDLIKVKVQQTKLRQQRS